MNHVFTVSSIKTFRNHDGGTSYSCDLLMDGKKIAECLEDGWGGPLQINYNNDLKQSVYDHCKAIGVDIIVDDLVNDVIDARRVKREATALAKKAATHILFRLKGDGESYRFIKKTPAHQDVAIRAHIVNKYGSKLESIYRDGAWVPVDTAVRVDGRMVAVSV